LRLPGGKRLRAHGENATRRQTRAGARCACGFNNQDWVVECARCGRHLRSGARPRSDAGRPKRANRHALQVETFPIRAFRVFTLRTQGIARRARRSRRRSDVWIGRRLQALSSWLARHWLRVIGGLAVAIWLALAGSFLFQLLLGQVRWSLPTGATALVAAALGLASSMVLAMVVLTRALVSAVAVYLAALILIRLAQFLSRPVLAVTFVVWIPLYALWQAALVATKLLLLVPLSVLVLCSRAAQLWRGVFYTCPSRACAYRGLPIHVCPDCGQGNRALWPNLYGLFFHYCVGCDRRLPAFSWLGRRQLARRCGGCEMPLTGRHVGKARERLVAIAGAPGSGKTSYLLMAVDALLAGRDGLRAEIDEPAQQSAFEREQLGLRSGMPAAKTSEVLRAVLLFAQMNGSKSQLYLYDAPGEEFASIGSMTRQQYLPLLEGFILLVDPLGFEAVRGDGDSGAARLTLQEVVNALLVSAAGGIQAGPTGKLAPRVAVVISKSDLPAVKRAIGAGTPGECRNAIAAWGGESALRALEHRFESVAYFACSPLGRAVHEDRGRPFQAAGVLEPLRWVLGAA
jgi:hypothetical protein